MQKALLFLLFLASCTHSDPHSNPWSLNQISSGNKKYNSTKLSQLTSDPVNGIDLEILCTQESLHTYLNIHSLPVPPGTENPKISWVDITVGEEKRRFEAYRHEGGQRLLLSKEASDAIVDALSQNQDLLIKIPGYSTWIQAKGFEGKFEKMHHHSHIQNPFYLPY